MGTALLGGLIAGGWDPADITVVEVNDEKRRELSVRFAVGTSAEIVAGDGALVAVKPGDVAQVCEQLTQLGTPRIISIAAGVTVAGLQAATSPTTAVIRAMPNTPALVRRSMTAVCAGSTCTDADVEWARSVLESVGEVVTIDEADMDAFTAVAGSGPAYLFLMAEALIAAGIERGLTEEVAATIVDQLFLGAGSLLASSTDSAAVLRERVTSPNGTTAAGLSVFEENGFRELVKKVVAAAADRSAEMQRELS